jgi:polyisoprenoid-binding protein YceI
MMNSLARPLASLALALSAIVPSTARAADTYSVDPVHSFVVFKVKHANTSTAWGRFNDLSGSFSLDPEHPDASKINLTIKAGSVDTKVEARDSHLKGPDFFNATQYPEITFVSKSVEKSSQNPHAYNVSGTLSFHGESRPLTLVLTTVGSGKDMRGHAIAGVDTHFTIKQSDFGIPEKTGAIGDNVTIFVSLEGVKK